MPPRFTRKQERLLAEKLLDTITQYELKEWTVKNGRYWGNMWVKRPFKVSDKIITDFDIKSAPLSTGKEMSGTEHLLKIV